MHAEQPRRRIVRQIGNKTLIQAASPLLVHGTRKALRQTIEHILAVTTQELPVLVLVSQNSERVGAQLQLLDVLVSPGARVLFPFALLRERDAGICDAQFTGRAVPRMLVANYNCLRDRAKSR